MQLQPNTTRKQFKVAYNRLVNSRATSPVQALGYVPVVRDEERALFESTAQSDLEDTTLVIRNETQQLQFTDVRALGTTNQIEPEYFPVLYMEPVTDERTRVRGHNNAGENACLLVFFFGLSFLPLSGVSIHSLLFTKHVSFRFAVSASYTLEKILYNIASSGCQRKTISRARNTSKTQASPPVEVVWKVGAALLHILRQLSQVTNWIQKILIP
jgi:hypothetical protein